MTRLRVVTRFTVTPRAMANMLGPGPPDMRLDRRDGYFQPKGLCGLTLS